MPYLNESLHFYICNSILGSEMNTKSNLLLRDEKEDHVISPRSYKHPENINLPRNSTWNMMRR